MCWFKSCYSKPMYSPLLSRPMCYAGKMSRKDIATQMRDFASNSASQALLLEDPSMLKTLVTFMEVAEDSETIIKSLETFYELSKPEQFRSKVMAIAGLLPKLATLMDREGSTDSDKQIRTLAKNTFDYLQGSIPGTSRATSSSSTSNSSSSVSSSTAPASATASSSSYAGRRSSSLSVFFLFSCRTCCTQL